MLDQWIIQGYKLEISWITHKEKMQDFHVPDIQEMNEKIREDSTAT